MDSDLTWQLKRISIDTLNFERNCTSTAAYFQQVLENRDGAEWQTSIEFILNSIPQKLAANISSVNDRLALLSWYLNIQIPAEALNRAGHACKIELCPLLQWEGEPDAFGIGVRSYSPSPVYMNHD